MGPYRLVVLNGSYELQICKFDRDNFENNEKCWMYKKKRWGCKAIAVMDLRLAGFITLINWTP